MVNLSKLPKTTTRAKKRVGRGIGSGKGGHTAGRGAKGQKARGKVPLLFEGTKIKKSLLKRLPFLRGKGKCKPVGKKPIIVNLKYLNLFSPKDEVDVKTLAAKGIVQLDEGLQFGVKILGEGELKIPLTVKLCCSKGAGVKIKKAGGTVLTQAKGVEEKKKQPAKESTKKDE